MDMLSAAMEVAANVDAAAAAAAVNVVADAAAAASAASNSSRSISPAGSSGRDTSGPSGNKGTESSDMDDEEAIPRENAQIPAPMAPTGMSAAARDMHAKLESQQEDIRNGKHPAIVEDTKRQDELKRRRQATAEEHCRLLMRNIDELRQAETRDNDAQTKVCLERTQEDLLDDMHQRIRQSKVDGGLGVKKGAKAVGGAVGGESDKFNSNVFLGRKRARLLPARRYEKVTPEAVLAKAEMRRIRTITLSDIEMRRDFQAIIMDWRERATKYLSTYNNSHWTKVNVCQDSFRVRGVTFSKGDPVVVTSRVTGEEFHGEITVVKPKAVFLSLYGGVKTRIFIDHISTGRLTVTRTDVKSNR